MALVAYGSSDESEEESEDVASNGSNCKPLQGLGLGITPCVDREPITNSNSLKLQMCPVYSTGHFLKKDTEFCSKPESLPALTSIEKPKHNTSANIDEIEQESDLALEPNIFAFIPIPNSSCNILTKGKDMKKNMKKIGQPVKITLPSLSEFIEEEEDEPIRKKLKPSEKGSGLFAILPAPKNIKLREAQRPFVPYVLTKKVTPAPILQKPSIRLKVATESVSLETQALTGYDSEDDEQDFFSLNTEGKLSKEGNDTSLGSILPDSSSAIGPEINPNQKPLEFDSEFHSSTWVNGSSEVGPQREVNWQGSMEQSEGQLSSVGTSNISSSQEDLQLDAEAMQRLCGRRSKKQQPVEFIEVNGREIMPDPNDWLVKQLSEEQPKMRSHSHKRNDGPTTQQRRKHQITYLAFQAKENELELKNQWSQNRMSRKQTQSKYGF